MSAALGRGRSDSDVDTRSRVTTSPNTGTVERYLDGFRRMGHARIL